MLTYRLSVHFPKGYIADPYWPEINRLITIQTESGVNRARSAANRRKALEEYLKGAGMTLADYERLEALARVGTRHRTGREELPFLRRPAGLVGADATGKAPKASAVKVRQDSATTDTNAGLNGTKPPFIQGVAAA